MKRLKLIFAYIFLLSCVASYSGFAQSTSSYDYDITRDYDTSTDTYNHNSGSSYDWRSGNSYRWNTNVSGTTTLNGYNHNTGSMWQTKIKPNGDMNGYDSDFNYWKYNKSTKTYYNFGTGEMRSKGIKISSGTKSTFSNDSWDY